MQWKGLTLSQCSCVFSYISFCRLSFRAEGFPSHLLSFRSSSLLRSVALDGEGICQNLAFPALHRSWRWSHDLVVANDRKGSLLRGFQEMFPSLIRQQYGWKRDSPVSSFLLLGVDLWGCDSWSCCKTRAGTVLMSAKWWKNGRDDPQFWGHPWTWNHLLSHEGNE